MKRSASIPDIEKIPPVLQESITQRIEETVTICRNDGYSVFITDRTFGFDTLAAEAKKTLLNLAET